MRTDLVLSPFGTRGGEVLAAARAADAGGFDVLWTYDHFGGAVVGAPWSRHPFVTLGAVAAVTERIGLGVLVANASNRHPAQLASAINTLQSLAPGRVCCGVGSGTAGTSPFAVEQHAIGRTPAPAPVRREHLRETIACLRAIWQNQPYRGAWMRADPPVGVVDGAPIPPIIVGGGSEAIVRLAAAVADGVNLIDGPQLGALVGLARELTDGRPFDVGVFTDLDAEHRMGGDRQRYQALGIDRRTLAASAPYPLQAIAGVGARLAQER
jgi:alkanesulfonate monooxygenase SsuD/methylene tetrahydromethanopterin reductase-like flavin-dependent oxidoreductase (luciferase family)